ncbi:MAG: PQQ-binding-like beta-propeller repeat protein, partial [Gammaproteobacteria bacterium]|nr:PQQ-binding-like beta-propeller repeat protein [Gammaproteobacteria bacterium]
MKIRLFQILLVSFFSWCTLAVTDATAQRLREMSSRSAKRLGLEPLWATSIPTGVGGRMTGVTVHISSSESYQVTEVTDKFGRKTYFSERDAGRAGNLLGLDQASRLAELKEAVLKARGLDPTVVTRTVSDISLYVRSSLGTVVSLDAETGRERWTTQAGKEGYPNYAVAASDEYLATVSGTTLYLLDTSTGN